MSGRTWKGFAWGFKMHLKGGWKLSERVLEKAGRCLKYDWKVCGRCQECFKKMSGISPECALKGADRGLESIWAV